MHVACTDYLTLMHVGGRSAADIDAGGVLPGFTGVLVRDGYAGYAHLPAVHAWCGAHLLRDLRSISDADPDGQLWALAMADTLLEARHAARPRPANAALTASTPTCWPVSATTTTAHSPEDRPITRANTPHSPPMPGH